MQNTRLPPSPLLRNSHICMKDAQCAETNEKSIFRFLQFLVFEFWLNFLEYFDHLTKMKKNNSVPEDAQCSETELSRLWTVVRFLVFEIWLILYS